MMRDMALPAVERDALIERGKDAILGKGPLHHPYGHEFARYYGAESLASMVLAAIEEQYVLIPKDQVTMEERSAMYGERWRKEYRATFTTPWTTTKEQ